jgi:hypothetical protein
MPGNKKKPRKRKTNKAQEEALHFSPLSNGLDFLLAGLEVLEGKPTPRQVKYAVLHVAAGIALVHKERLRREHWSLVFEDVRAASASSYESGEFRSVDFATCIKRLEDICGIKFEAAVKRRLDSLVKRRNRIEHFGISEPLMAAKASVSAVLGHVVAFIDEHLAPLGADDTATMDEMRRLLGAFEKFVEDRWKEIAADVQAYREDAPVVECPRCSQEALILGDGNPRCLFCGYKAEPTAAADDYLSNVLGLSKYAIVKDGGEWPCHQCAKCEMEAMVRRDDDYLCLCCGARFLPRELDRCPGCGRPYMAGSGEDDYQPMCSGCWDHLISSDHT